MHRHPWAIDFIGAGPPSGPNDARNADRLIGALDGLGLDAMTTMWALMTVSTYVMGAALREIQEIRWHRAADETTAAMTEDDVAEALRRVRAGPRVRALPAPGEDLRRGHRPGRAGDAGRRGSSSGWLRARRDRRRIRTAAGEAH